MSDHDADPDDGPSPAARPLTQAEAAAKRRAMEGTLREEARRRREAEAAAKRRKDAAPGWAAFGCRGL